MTTVDLRRILLDLFHTAVAVVQPDKLIRNSLILNKDRLTVCGDIYPLRPDQKVYIFGSGKASAGMAKAAAEILGDRLAGGTVVSNETQELVSITVLTGSHPVPDDRSIAAAKRLQHDMARLGSDDLYLYLLSGGSSALIENPLPSVTLDDIREVTRLLLTGHTNISDFNTVRKHLSALKGGRLRQSTRATGAVLVLSDVVGDDLAVIGSGPLYRDTSSFADARHVLDNAGIWDSVPAGVREIMDAGCAGKIAETPSTLSPSCRHYLVGSNRIALAAAAKRAKEKYGIPAEIMTSSLEGDAREAAGFITAISQEIRESSHPFPPPVCLLFGGETTVRVTGNGRGGRNQELALAALTAIGADPRAALLCGGSDGIDGNSHAAGAIADGACLDEARRLGLVIEDFQQNNDATAFFEQVGSLLVTGPTGTNVMDLIFALIL